MPPRNKFDQVLAILREVAIGAETRTEIARRTHLHYSRVVEVGDKCRQLELLTCKESENIAYRFEITEKGKEVLRAMKVVTDMFGGVLP